MSDNLTFVQATALTVAWTRGRDEPTAADLKDAQVMADRVNARRATLGLPPFSDESAPIRNFITVADEDADTDE